LLLIGRGITKIHVVHYALSCAEYVANNSEPATYNEVVASINNRKCISAMQ
jgi:hypothetical protein